MQEFKTNRRVKAGMRRLWAVLSVAWLIAVIGMTFDWGSPIKDFLVFGVVPVIALYVLGAAMTWVIEGFARTDR